MENSRTLEDIRKMLIHDGVNSTLVSKMNTAELLQADSYLTYDDYDRYITYLAHKYDI